MMRRWLAKYDRRDIWAMVVAVVFVAVGLAIVLTGNFYSFLH